jgi:hypothetical protein
MASELVMTGDVGCRDMTDVLTRFLGLINSLGVLFHDEVCTTLGNVVFGVGLIR